MMVCLMAELTSISVYLKHSVSAIAEFSSFRLRAAHLLGGKLGHAWFAALAFGVRH